MATVRWTLTWGRPRPRGILGTHVEYSNVWLEFDFFSVWRCFLRGSREQKTEGTKSFTTHLNLRLPWFLKFVLKKSVFCFWIIFPLQSLAQMKSWLLKYFYSLGNRCTSLGVSRGTGWMKNVQALNGSLVTAHLRGLGWCWRMFISYLNPFNSAF